MMLINSNFKLFINEYVVKRGIAKILVLDRTFSKIYSKSFEKFR